MKYTTTRPSLGERVISFFGLSIGMIALILTIRLVIDSSFRMAYPFIPQISEGLKLSITAFSWLLTIRSASGLLSPIFGALADKHGRRKIMILALLAQFFGLIGIAFSSGWGGALPMFLVGIAVNAFIPAQQAYISDRVPYERRGRALASVDMSFSLSGMVVMPMIGWLINNSGWRVPFIILSVLSLIALLLIWWKLPATEKRTQASLAGISTWKVLKRPNVLASVLVTILHFSGVGVYMTFWSIWLSADFDLDAVGLGLIATVMGLAEFSGVILAGLFIDKVGKRRGSMIGLGAAAITLSLLPLFIGNLTVVRGMLMLLGLWVEISIISTFPLYGEQAPDARATIFSLIALGNAIGLGVGPPLTSALWGWKGLAAVTSVGGLFFLLAFGVVWIFLQDHAPQTLSQTS